MTLPSPPYQRTRTSTTSWRRCSAEVTATDLPVTGHIPEFLDGRYLRNGPNPVAEVDPATYHWFTGDGMVHGVALQDGKAALVPQPLGPHRRCAHGLGRAGDGHPNLRAGMQSLGANTNVLAHAGKTLALVEGGRRQLRAHRRARHRGSVRFRRDPGRRLHRSSAS